MRRDTVALSTVLFQQVPDAVVLKGADALERFGLVLDAVAVLPDVLAWSQQHNTLICIEHSHDLDLGRLNALRTWSQSAINHMAFVSVFSNRATFAARMERIAFGTHVWFIDEPARSVFLSDSPKTSERYREIQLSTAR